MPDDGGLHPPPFGVGNIPETFNPQAVGIDEFNKNIIFSVINELKKE